MNPRVPKSLSRLLCYLRSTINYYRGSPGHPQLQMQLDNLNNLPKYNSLPSGYSIRTYREGDDPHWIKIIHESFGKTLGELPQITLKKILIKPDFDAQSLFFLIYNENPIGTICALTFSIGQMKTGYIHMVAVSQEHQGKKLGRALTLLTLQYFKKKGIQKVLLDTDDFRIQAIKTYRNLGFKPVYFDLNHKKRWSKVLKGTEKKSFKNKLYRHN